MKIILTGSRAYGKPTEDSDIDLVLLSETDEDSILFQILRSQGNRIEEDSDSKFYTNLRFGKLNLILCENPCTFRVWEEGTKLLQRFMPVAREQAVYVLSGFRCETLTLADALAYLRPKLACNTQ